MASGILRLCLAGAWGLGVLCEGVNAAPAEPPWLDLPTENRALFQGRPERFYMYVEREFEGVKSRPWEGGAYGFTRNPKRHLGRVIFTRFHEGIDISPVRRDARGEPLDEVRAAAEGEVVHVSAEERASNYGRYVVVLHVLEGSRYFTLYAHLGRVDVSPGQRLRQGQVLGTVGFTGAGITRERAHLHFEFCLMWSRQFEAWFAHYLPNETNRHGLYNGMNLAGLDVAALLKAVRQNPRLGVSGFLRKSSRPMLVMEIPDSRYFCLPEMYPWLLDGVDRSDSHAWAVVLSEHLIPLKIEPRISAVWPPRVEWLGTGDKPLLVASRGLVTGTVKSPRLTESGLRFAHLLTFPDKGEE